MTPLDIVRAWVAAVNARDVERALQLTAANFEVRGPRGSRRGHLALREWIEATPVDMRTLRVFGRDDAIVAVQAVTWRDAKGFAIGEGVVANSFMVVRGQLTTLARYDALDDALREAGLGREDEMHQDDGAAEASSVFDAAAGGTAGRTPPRHVVLLGDSILDNATYTAGEPDVTTHLRSLLPSGWEATLLAVDGATTEALPRQLPRVPAGASHLVVAIGGNDALRHSDVLHQAVGSTAEALILLERRLALFERSYRSALDAVLALGRPVTVCTIYNGRLEPAAGDAARTGLMLFNDTILRAAFERRVDVVELRAICTEPEDYTNPIEPSGTGGRKIAAAIALAVGATDDRRGSSRVWARSH